MIVLFLCILTVLSIVMILVGLDSLDEFLFFSAGFFLSLAAQICGWLWGDFYMVFTSWPPAGLPAWIEIVCGSITGLIMTAALVFLAFALISKPPPSIPKSFW